MNDDSPVAGDGDSSLLSFDIEIRKYIIHLFLGYSEQIETGLLKKKIVDPMTGTLGRTIRKTNDVECNRAYQVRIPDILNPIVDTQELTILEDHIQIIDCLIKTKPKNHHIYDEFKKWLTEHNNQQMIFKDAMNSWNKHRIMDVFKGGEIIKKTEEIICLLTGKIIDINILNILNNNIINLTKLTQPLSENLKLISDYPGYMYNTFIKTPDGKIFDLKRQIYSYILPVCLVNNDNIKKFKDNNIFNIFKYKDGNTSKKKELIQKLNEVVDKKTINKFNFLFKNFLNEIKEAADKAATEATYEAKKTATEAKEAAEEAKKAATAATAATAADKDADKDAVEAADKATAYTILKLYNDKYDKYKATKAEADDASDAVEADKAASDASDAVEAVEAAKAEADKIVLSFPTYDENFNSKIETDDLNLIHEIMKILVA